MLTKEGVMLPLTLCDIGVEQTVREVGGKQKVRDFLGELGIVPECTLTVVSSMGGNLIVKVKDSRVAISREMAAKILV